VRWVAAAASTALCPTLGFGQATIVLPGLEVVGTAPGAGSEIARDKVPANTQTLTAGDFSHERSSSLPEALLQRAAGVSINDATGNFFQPNVVYRGFAASPVVGTPQGLAVYQNGVRVNEAFGDTVNWDLIPEMGINRTSLLPNNPVFGLNALGGAITVDMKNGFTWQGREAELRGGSFGRRAVATQVGAQEGNIAGYITADALNDDGWRDRSPSRLRRIYGDLGWRDDRAEFHVNFTGASNAFGAAAPTPIQLLNRSWSAVFTTPQTTKNELAFITANGSYNLTETLKLSGIVYYRGFRQRHVDGNATDVLPCAADPTILCFDNDANPLLGPVPTSVIGDAVPGSIDRTWTSANSFGGSVQATSTSKVFDRDNHLVVGTSLDHGRVNFSATSELGVINPDLFITGTGVTIASTSGDVAPVRLLTKNTYLGFYATNTLDITSALSLTTGGRFNVAQIKLEDELGTALNGDHRFQRFNPVVGATYKLTPWLTAYGGYSEANRAPTASELGCADPARPCLLDNFLTSDPPLKQVVSHTYEAGLRGNMDLAALKARLSWSFGLFRTINSDDIMSIRSDITGRGFFQNVGGTRRQGIEASANYTADRWSAFVAYSLIDARFLDTIVLASPNNPMAVDGNIIVTPGNRIPSIPLHRLKLGADVSVTDAWKVGFDLIAASGQYMVGDESNLNAQIPGHWIANLRTSYKFSERVEAFGLVQNLFNQRYYTFGTFFDTGAIPFLGLTDPRTLGPGAPLAAYAGLRVKL
jgi:iron complex outermembrane receptor protein